MHKDRGYPRPKMDKYVDISKQEDFLFNRTPILASALQKLKKTSNKQSSQKKNTVEKKHRDSSDKEVMKISQPSKRVKKNPQSIAKMPNFAFVPLQKDLYSFYTINKTSIKAMDNIPQPKFEIGALVLAAICDRGVGGKFLVANLFRNKKGYIDHREISQVKSKSEKDMFNAIQTYTEPGEYVLCSVVKGLNPHHHQLSLSKFLADLQPKSFRNNQVLAAQIKSKQQLGCHLSVYKCESYKFFLPKSELSDQMYENLTQKKQIIVLISEIDHNNKLVKVRIASPMEQEGQQSSLASKAFNLRGIQEEQLSKFQLEQYVVPGTLVNTKIVKKMTNGIMVKFLKIFFGFIHIDHLSNPLQHYKEDGKILSRIIYSCVNPPLIYLSQRHVSLKKYEPKYALYSAISKPNNLQQVQNSYMNINEQIYIHPTQLHSQIENIGKFWVKQYNYFERYHILTSRKLGVRVGELAKEIPFSNFKIYSSVQQKTNQNQQKKFKVLCIDVWNKVVKISYDEKIIKSNNMLYDLSQINLENETEMNKQYCGFITAVKDSGVVVQFCNNIKGTLQKNQVKMSGMQIDESWKGKGIDVYITNIKHKNNFVTLSLVPPSVRRKSKNPVQGKTKVIDNDKEENYTGTIVSIVPNSINPIYIKLREKFVIKISIFKGVRPASLHDLPIVQNITEKFSVGQQVRVFKKNKQFYLYPPEQLSDINLRICRVVGQKGSYVRLQTNKNQFYSCHICDITDLILAHPFSTLKLGQYHIGRVLGNNMICLRNSIVLNGIPKSILDCKQKYLQDQLRGDYRNRILTVGSNGLKEDMVIFGYVKQFTEKGCFVSVSNDYEVRIQMSQLDDENIKGDKTKYYPQNKLILCRLTSQKVKPNDPTKHLFDASARQSVVKLGYPLNDDLLQVGLTVSGFVTRYTKGKVLVRLCGSKFTGILHPNQVPNLDKDQPIQKSLKIGTFFNKNLKIIEINNEGKRLIRLSCQPKYFNKYKDIQLNMEPQQRISNLYESYQQMLKQKTPETILQKAGKMQEVGEENSEDEYNRIKGLLADQFENEGEEDGENLMEEQLPQAEQQGMQEESEQYNEQSSQMQAEEVEKKGMNAKSQNASRILAQFSSLSQPEQTYQSLILANNTPQSHIQYISSMINKATPQQIREQFVKSISMIEEIKGKENIWITWLNMETILGDFEQTVKKAIMADVGLPVYSRILEILREQNNWEIAKQIGRKMLKKFNRDLKAYLIMLKHSLLHSLNFKQDEKTAHKQIIRRAKQCLKANDIIQIQSQYAKILYELKQAEKARTVFGDLLQYNPKRTDLWSMYVDLQIKHGSIDKAREILERSLTISLKKKKIITILKKYYQIESEHGTPQSAAQVLERAKNLAEEYAENEQESEEDNQ